MAWNWVGDRASAASTIGIYLALTADVRKDRDLISRARHALAVKVAGGVIFDRWCARWVTVITALCRRLSGCRTACIVLVARESRRTRAFIANASQGPGKTVCGVVGLGR